MSRLDLPTFGLPTMAPCRPRLSRLPPLAVRRAPSMDACRGGGHTREGAAIGTHTTRQQKGRGPGGERGAAASRRLAGMQRMALAPKEEEWRRPQPEETWEFELWWQAGADSREVLPLQPVLPPPDRRPHLEALDVVLELLLVQGGQVLVKVQPGHGVRPRPKCQRHI